MKLRYWLVILTYVVMQFSSLIFAPLLFYTLPITEVQAINYGTITAFITGLIVVLWIMQPEMKRPPKENAANGPEMFAWSLAGVFMAYLANSVAASIEMSVLGIEPGSENTEIIMNIIEASPLFVIIPALIAPILEEIVFRKIIFGTLYKRTNFFIAAILSAIIFGLIHGEPEHILVYTSMGFVFAFLYVKTKRIIVPTIVHMLLNSLTIILQYALDLDKLEQKLHELETMQTIIGG